MPNTLMQAFRFIISPSKKTAGRNELSFRQQGEIPGRSVVFLASLLSIFIVSGLLLGCGGPAGQLPPQQVVAQFDSQAKQNRLQEQLLKQVAQVSVVDYKDYKVGPEDLLEINFLDTEKLRADARVNGQGEIRLLLIGDIPVAGLTPAEVAKKLVHLYKEGDYLKDPNITVAIKEFRHQKVAVTGAVNKPDSYALIGPRTLLEVLGMAGGLSDKAGETAHIIRSRKGASRSQAASPAKSFSPGSETIVVDLNRLLLKGAVDLNSPVHNGDVVFIPFAQTAYVLGSVTKPGGVFIKDNLTVTKAIAQTGGQHIMLSSNSATILRLDDHGQRQTIPVNLAQITKGNEEDLPLKENDIVYVQESGVRRFLFDFKMLMPGSVSVSPAAMF
jgi:polysaccharide export outer membrane protein